VTGGCETTPQGNSSFRFPAVGFGETHGDGGATLVRLALGRLRDLVMTGTIDRKRHCTS
jgi:hypothetical protein